jgi:transposase InsO family protein
MKRPTTPYLLLVSALAGWLNREQQQVLEYLREENRVLREQLGKKRLRLTDAQRRRLAAKGHAIGRRLLGQFACIVTPGTILRWHRQLIAAKWTYAGRKVGRPPLSKETEELIVRMARANPTWGYRRIQGALANLGKELAHNTVKRVLQDHGIDPAPERPTTWSQFLRAHWSIIAATDFFTTEVWTASGLTTIYTLFVMRLETRRIHIVGSTANPGATFMQQAALDLAGFDDGFLRGCTHLLIDRDGKFNPRFREVLKDNGVEPVRLPARSPNLNAYAERFVRSIKRECLDRMVFFGQRSLERALKSFADHYHVERNHQGLGNALIDGEPMPEVGEVLRRERLGGLLSFYHRAA